MIPEQRVATSLLQHQEPSRSSLHGHKYLWNYKQADPEEIFKISLEFSLTQAIAQVLINRGYRSTDSITTFLFSSYERDVAHASQLKDALAATTRILEAIKNKEKILIFGDYDVDGATSCAVMLLALKPLGADINYFLPNRIRDGYGISAKAVRKAVANGYKLIITVDNGISAHEAATEASLLGIDLIITDHHRPHGTLPQALSIVNPNQTECLYPFKHFAGVGVAFKLMNLIYEQLNKELPHKIYELLTLGTIADVVPLIGENRYWVQHGLSKINKNRSYALEVLAANSNLTKNSMTSLDIGFMIAPQINALGRLDDARDAVKFLISANQEDIERVGLILKNINEERKKIEQNIYQEVEAAIHDKIINLTQEPLIMAASTQWPAGVIGLVAGKIMHNYGRPTILLHADTKEGVFKGSCRSIPEFDIFNALTACSDLLLSFGGHSFAAGLKFATDNLTPLQERLSALITLSVDKENLVPKLNLDAELSLNQIDHALMKDLERLEPFGNRNPQPAFIIRNVSQIKPPTLLKDKHVKCSIFSEGTIKPIIFFNRPELYRLLKDQGDYPFHIAAHITKNEWQGNISIELQGLDVAFENTSPQSTI